MSRLTNPVLFFNDSQGLILPYAKLYFYENNTITPQNTYSDAALTDVNPNPVEADAAGRFPNIFLTDNEYRVELRDEFDVQVWQRDDVVGFATSGGGTGLDIVKEVISASDNQTVFNTSSPYSLGSNNLSVYINGVKQDENSYSETTTTSFTLTTGSTAGDDVEYIIINAIT